MTTSLDTEVLLAVTETLDEVGTDMTFESVTETYDATDGTITESGSSSTTVKAAPPYEFEARLIGQDGILTTDLQTLIAGDATFTPTIGMKVTWSSTDYIISRVSKIVSGDDIAAYHLRLSV